MANLNKSEFASFVDKFTMGSLLDGKKRTRENQYMNERSQHIQTSLLPDNVVVSLRTIGNIPITL